MVHDPVEQGQNKYNSFLISMFTQVQLRAVSFTCAAKLFSNVKLELTCSNNGVVGH